jgi:hypothetical protein
MTTQTTSPTASEPVGQEHPLAEAGREITQDAGHLAERAADIGLQRADQGREQVAETVERVAGGIRRVSTELQSEEPAVADVAMTAADQAERVARYLRDTDARQLIRTVEDVARRQPLLFLGGAFVVGFAASRFLRAAGGSTNGSGSSYGYNQGAYAIESSGSWDTGSAGMSGTEALTGTGATTGTGAMSGTGASTGGSRRSRGGGTASSTTATSDPTTSDEGAY